MRLPPAIVALRILEQDKTRFRMWCPLFLFWPLLLVVAAIALAVALLADAVRPIPHHPHPWTRLAIGAMNVIGETPGTELHVKDASRTVILRVR